MQFNNVTTVGVLQPSYLPWLGCFEQIARSDVFVIYDDVQFVKGSWRNRNRIKTAQGVQWLTVPVSTKGQGFPLINQVHINQSQSWQKKHIKTLNQNYGKARYFEQYAQGLFNILDRSWSYLIDLNFALIKWFLTVFEIDTRLILSSELNIEGTGTQRLVDIVSHLGGNTFYEGSVGKNYLEEVQFEKAGIQIEYQEYSHPTYHQMFGDFIPYLSVIDLLFNSGSKSLEIIMGKTEIP